MNSLEHAQLAHDLVEYLEQKKLGLSPSDAVCALRSAANMIENKQAAELHAAAIKKALLGLMN
ncbi:hypothetical protein [Rheinheimera sp.]|uniref:hypothetical protein n=1 Tax=Rheinheimera sp. TaxID=1869214 RepID=UPI00307E82DD